MLLLILHHLIFAKSNPPILPIVFVVDDVSDVNVNIIVHATFEPAVTSDTFASIAIVSAACCENIINDKLKNIDNNFIFLEKDYKNILIYYIFQNWFKSFKKFSNIFLLFI